MEDNFAKEIYEQASSEEGQRLADELFEKYKAEHAISSPELKEQDILKVLKVSYIAERFFGRSRSWICRKLNHNMMNGKPDDFTAEERKKLKAALETIAEEIQEMADSM